MIPIKAEQFIEEAYQHFKTIGLAKNVSVLPHIANKNGVANNLPSFIQFLSKHRHWER